MRERQGPRAGDLGVCRAEEGSRLPSGRSCLWWNCKPGQRPQPGHRAEGGDPVPWSGLKCTAGVGSTKQRPCQAVWAPALQSTEREPSRVEEGGTQLGSLRERGEGRGEQEPAALLRGLLCTGPAPRHDRFSGTAWKAPRVTESPFQFPEREALLDGQPVSPAPVSTCPRAAWEHSSK